MGLQGPSRIGCCCGCECEPEILARQTVRNNLPAMDLTPYQGPKMACPGSRFRLQESSAVIYSQGTVNSEGRLVGLISSYKSSYSYYGYMRLEIGCVQPNGSILWPTWTNVGQPYYT